MPHQRLLDALDSSSPLLFIEAISGSGKRTVLRQWEQRGGNRHGEIRLRFNARRLPPEPSALSRIFWSALRHRLRQDLPALPTDDSQLEQAMLGHLRDLRRPIAVAVHDADRLSPEMFAVALRLLDGGIRLIIAGNDLAGLVRAAQRRGIYYSTLSDRELWLTLTETIALLDDRGLELEDEAVLALHQATGGHPEMIGISLAALPIETAKGVLTRDRVMAAFFAEQAPEGSPSGFGKFLSTASQLPRFTIGEAGALMGGDDAAGYVSRLLALDVGRMVWHSGVHERVYRWDESVRQVLRRAMPLTVAGETEWTERVLQVARAAGDEELLLCALVRAGELDQAEALLREQIWDLLPNAMAPLWDFLERLSPLALLDRPALLSARLRLSPHRSDSPASEQAALMAARQIAAKTAANSPWRRVGQLAYAMGFALYAGEREQLIDLFTRARDLIEDLVGSEAAVEAGGREISELLLIADCAFRSGNTIPSAQIARSAAGLIEREPHRLDPRGERLDFARRVILHDHRARGLEDLFDPESLLAGPQFFRRDCDIVVAEMTLMWDALDDGDFEAADAHLEVAASRVADPEGWPILLLMRAHLAVQRRAPVQLEKFLSAYERSTLSEPGPFAQQSHSQMERITAFLGRQAGRPVASPGYLPVVAGPGGLAYPRTEFVVHLMEALYAQRAERPVAARAALARAAVLSPRREIGLYTLSNAAEHEVKALQKLAEEVPGGARLHLERALRFAGNLHTPRIELSTREQEVLEQLRASATNQQMAEAMFVSVNTVKFHRANLMRKLGAKSRHDVLEAAARLGL